MKMYHFTIWNNKYFISSKHKFHCMGFREASINNIKLQWDLSQEEKKKSNTQMKVRVSIVYGKKMKKREL